MKRARIAGATAACACVAALLPVGGSGAKPSNTCPPGFNLGALTFQQWLALPRTQAEIRDEVATVEQILAGLAGVDKNGNGVVCGQLSRGLEVGNAPGMQYIYNVVDDNASTPS